MKILCKRHGRSGADLACQHVASVIEGDLSELPTVPKEIDPFGPIIVCTECAEQLERATSEDLIAVIVEKYRPVCAACLAVLGAAKP